MSGIFVDAWAVVAYTDRLLAAEDAEQTREVIDRELVATVKRLSGLLGPSVKVRIEQ